MVVLFFWIVEFGEGVVEFLGVVIGFEVFDEVWFVWYFFGEG